MRNLNYIGKEKGHSFNYMFLDLFVLAYSVSNIFCKKCSILTDANVCGRACRTEMGEGFCWF